MKLKRILVSLAFAGIGLRAMMAEPRAMRAESSVAIYFRATNFFSEMALFKPLETEPENPFFGFAPLVLQEVGNANGEQGSVGATKRAQGTARPTFGGEGTTGSGLKFGTLVMSNGVVRVDTSRPAMYAAMDAWEGTGGKTHPRFTYLWCYVGKQQPVGESALQLQGVRITLDSQGQPAIWEVLADGSGGRVLFVSESLEAAAAAQYGTALEGRRFAIERSATEAPNVIVGRVLQDGPVPMGPIVYVMAGRQDVSTIICRCMPAQAQAVTEARNYEILSFSWNEQALAWARERMKGKVGFWPGIVEGGERLEKLLRLPETF